MSRFGAAVSRDGGAQLPERPKTFCIDSTVEIDNLLGDNTRAVFEQKVVTPYGKKNLPSIQVTTIEREGPLRRASIALSLKLEAGGNFEVQSSLCVELNDEGLVTRAVSKNHRSGSETDNSHDSERIREFLHSMIDPIYEFIKARRNRSDLIGTLSSYDEDGQLTHRIDRD